MRQGYGYWVSVTALRHWRNAANALALVALFANAALLPALHSASAWSHRAVPQAHSINSLYPHHVHDTDGHKQPANLDHQVCHFCRLLGAVLPPPSLKIIETITPSQIVRWPVTDAPVPRQVRLGAANLPRAPPLPA
jgi:hypothetical protein